MSPDETCPTCGDGDSVPAYFHFLCSTCDAEWHDDFDQWSKDLVKLAQEKGVEWALGDVEDLEDCFCDEMTPAETLDSILSCIP